MINFWRKSVLKKNCGASLYIIIYNYQWLCCLCLLQQDPARKPTNRILQLMRKSDTAQPGAVQKNTTGRIPSVLH